MLGRQWIEQGEAVAAAAVGTSCWLRLRRAVAPLRRQKKNEVMSFSGSYPLFSISFDLDSALQLITQLLVVT